MITTDPRTIAPICEAIAAPVLAERGPAPIKARGGRARLLKTESGRIVTHGEVMGALLARAEIEVAVVDGKRPEWIACADCKVPVKVVNTTGYPPRKCKVCSGKECCVCGGPRTKEGKGMCRACTVKTGALSESLRKRHASMTPEQRKNNMRNAIESQKVSMPPDRRAELARKANEARTPEQKARIAEKARNQFSAEERSALSKANATAKTPEQRSESARKAWDTKRAKKAAEAAP